MDNGDARRIRQDGVSDNDASDRFRVGTKRDAKCDAKNDASENTKRDANNDASDLDILYTNAQSVVNKIEELRILTAIHNPDIVIVTESWTNESVSNVYLNVNGYDIIERQDRKDTDKGRGGGIIVYVKKSLCAWREECDTIFNQ